MRQSKYCNCSSSSKKEILKSNINYSFCDKCGCILIKDTNGNIFQTLKHKQNLLECDLNPIDIIKNMKRNTEKNHPFINQEFNLNKDDKLNIDNELNSIDIYLKYRKMLILNLQKLIIKFDYCDKVFYQCLFFLDVYLSHHLYDFISKKKILYYLIGYFLCSIKFKENDDCIPPLTAFNYVSSILYLSTEQISYYEVLCLQKINFNIFCYSAYDWLVSLINNGIVFNCEINNSNRIILIKGHKHSLINTINKTALKLLLNLTSSKLFFKYSPMQLALSIIQISREKFIDEKLINKELFFNLIKIYDINPADYKKCYEEIKAEIKEIEHSENEDNKDENEEQSIFRNKANNINYNTNKKIEIDENYKNSNIKAKNETISNKSRTSKFFFQCKDNFISRNNNNNNEELIHENNNKNEKEKHKEAFSLNGTTPKKRYEIRARNREIIDKNIKGVEHFPTNLNGESFKTIYNFHKSYSKQIEKVERTKLKHIPNLKLFKSIDLKNRNNDNNFVSPSVENKEEINDRKNIKLFSHKNLDNFSLKIEQLRIDKKFTSKKLPQLKGLDQFNNNRIKHKILGANNINNIFNNKKDSNLIGNFNKILRKPSFPEDDIKTIKVSNSRLKEP